MKKKSYIKALISDQLNNKTNTNNMLNKITYATALLATAALAEQELEVNLEARALADAFHDDFDEAGRSLNATLDELDEFLAGGRELMDDFIEEDLAEEGRDLQGSVAAWPWPFPFYRLGYCRMRANPSYRTTNPYGVFRLYEYGPWAPMTIYGYMR